MSPGQQTALTQLRLIASANPHALEIQQVVDADKPGGASAVHITISIGDIQRTPDGLPLRDRESFVILIPEDFPFDQPSTLTPHTRFAGRSHVQWKRSICLYQSSTEWNPSDGMFGYLDRLWLWIEKGAVNQLDPAGMPIHPPAVYAGAKGRLIIPTANTPEFEGPYWIGAAVLKDHTHYLEIASWHAPGNIPLDEKLAVAVLMGTPVAWEYPSKGKELFSELDLAGLPTQRLYDILEAATIVTPPGDPLHFILGAPMRGISGEKPKQHLSVWHLDSTVREDIAFSIEKPGEPEAITEISKRIQKLNLEILALSPVTWCPVIEARSETTVRRDSESPLTVFRDKSVTLWGCGALGSHIASILCRAGIRRLSLWDTGLVTPGIMVRQDFVFDDIGRRKVDAVADRLRAINPKLEIETHHENIARFIARGESDWTQDADFVIDATASSTVRQRLEMAWNSSSKRVPLAAIMVDQDAQKAIAGVVFSDASGGTWDLFRKAKIELLRRQEFGAYADAFFPTKPSRAFQPEPGCSDPTFRGSAADSMGLAASALNLIAKDFAAPGSGFSVHLFQAPEVGAPRTLQFSFPPEIVSDAGTYQVRISGPALKEMKATVAQNRRVRGHRNETGGLLWGEWDEAMRIVFVTDASGPPPDSSHSEQLFICGTVGTAEEATDRQKSSRSAVSYIGMWHTHPVSSPSPSDVDITGMTEILTVQPGAPRSSLLMIVGSHGGKNVLGNYLFERHAIGANLQLLSFGRAWHHLDQKIL